MPLFLKVINFVSQKRKKSPGLVQILQQIPVDIDDEDMDGSRLTLNM